MERRSCDCEEVQHGEGLFEFKQDLPWVNDIAYVDSDNTEHTVADNSMCNRIRNCMLWKQSLSPLNSDETRPHQNEGRQ